MKAEIRRKMLALRRAIPPSERAAYSHRICTSLLHSPLLHSPLSTHNSQLTIAIYLATADEISLDEFIISAPPTIRFAAPRWSPTTRTYTLAHLPAPHSQLSTFNSQLPLGPFGIREPPPDAPSISPSEIDIWLVPGLAFTMDGKRLGYGGGYYDRFLANASPNATSIAIAYPFQILPSLPTSPHDLPISQILTA